MKSYSGVVLNGGLGNQLFQLAAGLSFFEEEFYLNTSIGNPRKNSRNEIDISELKLPSRVEIEPEDILAPVIKKFFNYSLRSGISKIRYSFFGVTPKLIILVNRTYLLLKYRRLIDLQVATDVGFCNFSNKTRNNELYLGYFQSSEWFDNSQTNFELHSICPKGQHPLLQQLERDSKREVPLIVHVRLGDYKGESMIGIPSSRYYSEAINKLWGSGAYKKIWLFSDELDHAEEFIPNYLRTYLRKISEVDYSSAVTLEAMKLGHGYVIGNSTFSWWGAYLSRKSDAQVIAPTPWFVGMEEPSRIIPQHWLRVEANFL